MLTDTDGQILTPRLIGIGTSVCKRTRRQGPGPFAPRECLKCRLVTGSRLHELRRDLLLARKWAEIRSAAIAAGLAPASIVAGFSSHREFGAWQLAYSLRRALLPVLRHILHARDFALHRNMREAARSAPRNIAEGFGRFKHKDFAKFVRIAKASEVEMLEHLLEAHVSGYIDEKELATFEHMTKTAIKAANGLIRYLESTPDQAA